jgi:hypothetical protein
MVLPVPGLVPERRRPEGLMILNSASQRRSPRVRKAIDETRDLIRLRTVLCVLRIFHQLRITFRVHIVSSTQ